jgi:hypothetical protein
MADGIEIKLEGFEKLDRNLLELGGAAGERIVRAAVRAAGKVVQAEIVERAPVRTDDRKTYGENGNPAWSLPPGALKSDIKLRVTKDGERGGFTAYVGPGKYSRPVAYWLEFGHAIVKGGRMFNWGKRGTGQQVGFVAARPFIRPAMEMTQDAAIAAAEEAIADELEKELRKMGAV